MFTGCSASKERNVHVYGSDLAGKRVGTGRGYDSWKNIKGNSHVRLLFLCVPTSLLQSRATERHPGGGALCLLQPGTCRSTLQRLHVCRSGSGTFTHGFQTGNHSSTTPFSELMKEARGVKIEGAALHRQTDKCEK